MPLGQPQKRYRWLVRLLNTRAGCLSSAYRSAALDLVESLGLAPRSIATSAMSNPFDPISLLELLEEYVSYKQVPMF
jgi:hypothetical protein